jgi:group I intron endonuclease
MVDIKDKSGIYIITCLINGKHYIGRSLNVRTRLLEHKNKLRKNEHENEYLQRAFNVHGVKNFKFNVLEYHDGEYLVSMENYWCNLLNTHNKYYGYNLRETGEGNFRVPETAREKIGKANSKYIYAIKKPNDEVVIISKLSEFVEENGLCLPTIHKTYYLKDKNGVQYLQHKGFIMLVKKIIGQEITDKEIQERIDYIKTLKRKSYVKRIYRKKC